MERIWEDLKGRDEGVGMVEKQYLFFKKIKRIDLSACN